MAGVLSIKLAPVFSMVGFRVIKNFFFSVVLNYIQFMCTIFYRQKVPVNVLFSRGKGT